MESIKKQFQIFFISEGQKHCAFGAHETEAKAVESVQSETKQRGMEISEVVAVAIPYSEDANSKTWTFDQWGDVVVEKAKEGDALGVKISIERPDISGFLELQEDADREQAWNEVTIDFTAYYVDQLIQKHKSQGGGLQDLLSSMIEQLAENCDCPKCQARRNKETEQG